MQFEKITSLSSNIKPEDTIHHAELVLSEVMPLPKDANIDKARTDSEFSAHWRRINRFGVPFSGQWVIIRFYENGSLKYLSKSWDMPPCDVKPKISEEEAVRIAEKNIWRKLSRGKENNKRYQLLVSRVDLTIVDLQQIEFETHLDEKPAGGPSSSILAYVVYLYPFNRDSVDYELVYNDFGKHPFGFTEKIYIDSQSGEILYIHPLHLLKRRLLKLPSRVFRDLF
jgi:hypothetical protein